MAAITVRNVDEATRAGLKRLGAEHGRSMESEARAFLTEAVRSRGSAEGPVRLGSRIHEMFADLEWPGADRPPGSARAASFEEQ